MATDKNRTAAKKLHRSFFASYKRKKPLNGTFSHLTLIKLKSIFRPKNQLCKETLEPCIESITKSNDLAPILLAELEKYVIHQIFLLKFLFLKVSPL